MKKILTILSLFIAATISAFDATIPVLDMQDYHREATKADFLKKLEKASHEVGFFALINTGVDPEILDVAYAELERVSHAPRELKMKYFSKSYNGQRGYIPGESAKGAKIMDTKEFWHIAQEYTPEEHKRRGVPPNVWPKEFPEFQKAMVNLFDALMECSTPISEAFSELLGQDKDFLSSMIEDGETLMRPIFYPANPPANSEWSSAHTDIDLYTILPRSTARGLQIYNNHKWIDVIVPDGAFVVNCGDMLENLANGYTKSSFHRVMDPGLGQERLSLVHFVSSRNDSDLSPLPCMISKTGGKRVRANINRLELLAERLFDLGIGSRELMHYFVGSGAIERLREVGRFSPKAEQALKDEGLL
ncbi:MAG: hypothetical protein MRY21_05845 [Simkaniaceae bacterium]|nr:hypothetical protein [Simkaniaceae bacterium]